MSQSSRKAFGLPEKHKDYVVRAQAFHKKQKEETLRKIEKLTAVLHSVDNFPSSKHIYYAEDRQEARQFQLPSSEHSVPTPSDDIPHHIKRKVAASYRELEARKSRLKLEKIYADMCLKKELQKKDRKRKLCEDELKSPTSNPVYKWRSERKR
ncbi:Small-subunit processome, Utp11 [Corchorus capsularis]|uniref:Small-subunit processome, Utp11 n=1 Tax=Corchorus capsularis TaxID=210143 RepID=A0A1R3G339_COCAP|nr:Small-subunit processome, Utp11 [Corchorus capsularis]